MTSCSDQNETTNETISLQVSINFSDIARQEPASDDDDTSNHYRAVVKLSGDTGDIMGVKWIEEVTSDNNTVTFDSVPVGANVEIEANMFDGNHAESVNSHIYNGKSDNFRVKSGTNKVTLPMKNLSISDNDTPVYTAELETTFDGKEYSDFSMSFYENGKFILAHSTEYEDNYTSINVISQGIWSGTSDVFTNGGTISITEYAFKDGLSFNEDILTSTSACYSAGFTKNIITVTVTDKTCNFSFESGGLTFSTVSN